MAKELRRKLYYTCSELGRMCEVDIKTIHNWSKRGDIETFRTPGGHRRIKHAEVVRFLVEGGYDVPAALLPERKTVDRVA